ncbi:MAG: N-acetylmuramic acid 6-phosphate etherase, partial [Erysipelotrichaceae bacterium]|nr:N-acetylmuramic acid 6-phosphate etherase [Erysipelotrichaceae bacterium]
GPEVVTGSTRLKSGTCQKIVLNMISTVTMVKVGKVFGNLMVDVKATNEKLVERCRRVVMEATGCDHDEADAVLKETENNCKLAIVMILLNIPLNEAKEKLAQADDNIRIALN